MTFRGAPDERKTPPTRVLFTYAVPGSGHAQAAAALRQELELTGQFVVDEYHLLRWSPRALRFLPWSYRWVMRHTPMLWRHTHGNLRYRGLIACVVLLARIFGFFGLRKRIRDFQPNVILATHFFQAQMLGEARRLRQTRVPVFVLVTDYGAHPFWVHPCVDRYFVACDEAKRDLTSRGVSDDRVLVTGIPVKQDVLHLPAKQEAARLLGLDPGRKHILILGGSYGLFPFQDILREIMQAPEHGHYQWLVVFGGDTAARQQADRWLHVRRGQADSILTFGFQPLAPFFALADVAIMKPGGISVSEALVSGLSLIFHQPLPGQEERNARFLLSHQAAICASTPRDAVQNALMLLRDDKRRQELCAVAHRIARPQAGREIVREIERCAHLCRTI